MSAVDEEAATTGRNAMPGWSGRRSTRKRGQAMVEFALVLPIFLLILTGLLDFGFALYSRMTVINSAREGARAAVMVSYLTGNYSQITNVATQAATTAAVSAGLTPTSVAVSCLQTTVSVSSPPACNFNPYSSGGNPTGAQSGDSVVVRVNYTWTSFFPLPLFSTLNLSSSVQMVIE